jgi:hypothetical protein
MASELSKRSRSSGPKVDARLEALVAMTESIAGPLKRVDVHLNMETEAADWSELKRIASFAENICTPSRSSDAPIGRSRSH